jgi:hypothetical protein
MAGEQQRAFDALVQIELLHRAAIESAEVARLKAIIRKLGGDPGGGGGSGVGADADADGYANAGGGQEEGGDEDAPREREDEDM